MAGPGELVSGPGFTPLPYGLLSVVENPPRNGHWAGGLVWQSQCVTGLGASTYDECIVVTGAGAPLPPPSKTSNVQNTMRAATPFTAYTEYDCSPVGMEEALAVASNALKQAEPWQIERAFWTGTVAGVANVAWPHLAGGGTPVLNVQGQILQQAVVTVTGAPVDVATGLGLLEQAMADCYNGVGTIHMARSLLPTATAFLRPSGPKLVTLGGNVVAAGAGYPGTSPTGAAPTAGATWVFATGPVMAYRGDVRTTEPRESLDRSKNTRKMIAERTNVLGFDCCLFALQMKLGVPVS